MLFGGITIVCGIVGTLAGGLFLDRISSTISNAFKVNLVDFHLHIVWNESDDAFLDWKTYTYKDIGFLGFERNLDLGARDSISLVI